MLKKIIPIFLVLLLIGCKNYYLTTENGVRPKQPKFKLKNEYLKNSDNLDTNSVYICKVSNTEDSSVYEYILLRFFSNGRVYSSFPLNSMPNESDFNNLNSGIIGYYVIESKTIRIELFGLFFSDYQYMKYEGLVDKEYIHFTRAVLNKLSSYKINDRYFRSPAKLTGTANW